MNDATIQEIQLKNTLEFAQQLDEQDELAHFRKKFHIPQHLGKDKIYFDGNSLGLQPIKTIDLINDELKAWAGKAGDAHFHAKWPWYSYHEIFPQQLSKLVGCLPEEVVVMNSLSVNLHLMLVSFYRPTSRRYKIICEYKAFPSDQYVFESQVKYNGYDPADAIVEVKPRAGEHSIHHEDIIQAIKEHGDSIALVMFSGVNYYTGQVFNMPAITEMAHKVGALAGFDLAHAVGNIELNMHGWKVDFACWCTYKYLNSGPGSVGGAYIHEKHASNKNLPRFAGWWGYDKRTRFEMKKGFDPMPTAEGWQLSNAPVLSMAAHKAALDIFEEAGLDRLIKKGQALSDFLIFILEKVNRNVDNNSIEIITPKKEKGCQVSFIVKNKGKELYDHLMDNGVAIGWREPAVIRATPVPLYNTFEEVFRFGQLIQAKLST